MSEPVLGSTAAIADYEFTEWLGHGNHGEVYLAKTPPRLKLPCEEVAVKVLPKGASEEGFRRALRELKLFATIDSPYVVQVFDAGQVGDNFYYSLEYFPLGSLVQPVRALTRTESRRAVAHAALAADVLHESGIVHRDIRPANIMLHEKGAKLADLGMAQFLSPGFTVTSMGPVASAEYTDPEVIRGGAPSRSSDIWSIGVTLHWALTGKSVYSDLPLDEPVLTLRRLLRAVPTVSTELSTEEAEIVKWCLAAESAERPRTARSVADAISNLPPVDGEGRS